MATKLKRYESSDGSEVCLAFHCPGCDAEHPFTIRSKNPIWTWNGSMDSPTFAPSLLVAYSDDARCHTFVRDGKIQFLGDCSHALAGQTVDIPDWKEN
jgi:hypothetical protein